jgi:hypothetical protein
MDPDPTPDPPPFFTDFKEEKNIFINIFFLTTCPQAHHLQCKKYDFLLIFCVKILFCRHYRISVRSITFMRKGMDPEPDPYL